jgi:hypothetical protein
MLAKRAVDLPTQPVTPVVGGAAGHPGTTDGERTMNDTNKLTRTEEEPALHEVETSKLQAIVGGHLAGHTEPPPQNGYPWPTPALLQ